MPPTGEQSIQTQESIQIQTAMLCWSHKQLIILSLILTSNPNISKMFIIFSYIPQIVLTEIILFPFLLTK